MIASRSAAIRLLALAFALGALLGGGVVLMVDRGSHPPDVRTGGRQSYLSRLSKEVGLTSEQQQAVARVLDRHEPVMDSMWRSVRAPFDAQRQAVRREIRAVLTPEQVVKYDAMIARRDSLHRARENQNGNK